MSSTLLYVYLASVHGNRRGQRAALSANGCFASVSLVNFSYGTSVINCHVINSDPHKQFVIICVIV